MVSNTWLNLSRFVFKFYGHNAQLVIQNPHIYCHILYTVMWLSPTATSTNTLLDQVMGAVPGQDVVRYGVAGGGGGWGNRGGGAARRT